MAQQAPVETVHVIGQNKPKLPKELSQPPPVAIPTVLLAICNFLVWLTVQILYSYDVLPYYICLPLWTITVYIGFTPMHDASHSSIATKSSGYGYLNDVIGHISAIVYFHAPYRMFRFVHLMHHKYANIPGYDPDHFSAGHGPFVPIKWFVQMWAYLVFYAKFMKSRPQGERMEFVVFLIAFFSLLFYDIYTVGPLRARWMLPTSLGAGWTVFVFDYIPHRPHANKDIFIGTNVTSLYGQYTEGLTMPLLWQNYHNIHHLYPWIPFYKYSAIWFKFKETFLKKGTKIRAFFPIF